MKKEYIIEILILILIVLCAGSITYKAYQTFFASKNTHTLYFKDVDGIVKGSPVHFLGVTIGHVEELKYRDGLIIAKILVTKRGVTIPEGAVAKVQFSGLAGSKSIEIQAPVKENAVEGVIITENPLRVKDIFEGNRNYVQTVVGIESKIKLLPMQNIYEILEKTTAHYDWSNVDKMLDKTSEDFKKKDGILKTLTRREQETTKEIENINKIISK